MVFGSAAGYPANGGGGSRVLDPTGIKPRARLQGARRLERSVGPAIWMRRAIGRVVESFLQGSRGKEFARKRNRFLAYAGAVLLLITGLFAAEQTRHAHLADAQVQRLTDQLGTLEKNRDNAKTEAERSKFQSEINAIQSKIAISGGLQQEVQDLRAKLADATKQPKAVVRTPRLRRCSSR